MAAMHSTAVRLLRSALPLGLLVSFTTAVYGQTFKAVGTVSRTYPNSSEGLEAHRAFRAFVHEGSWLIRTTDADPKHPVAYNEDAFNGTDGFQHIQHTDLKPDPKFAGVITSTLTINATSVPDERLGSLISPVWLALASADYFKKLTNSVVAPLWPDSPKERMANYAATGKWKLTNQPPSVLSEAAFYETAGWLTGPYEGGFLKQRYYVTWWTNLNGRILPLEAVLEEYAPKVLRDGVRPVMIEGKIAFIGKDRDDTELVTRYALSVSRYELNAKPARFEPTPPARTYVYDFRVALVAPNGERVSWPVVYELANHETATNRAVRVNPIPTPKLP